MKKLIQKIKIKKQDVALAVVIALAAVFLYSTAVHTLGGNLPKTLEARDIIRLHILAQDDSQKEQDLKLTLRDGIWLYIEATLEGIEDVDVAKVAIKENLSQIEELASQILEDEGFSHQVIAILHENLDFPSILYGSLFLPKGGYNALQIIIGDGEGSNWWCIMFPTMCLIDIAVAEVVVEPQQQQTIIRPRFRIFSSQS